MKTLISLCLCSSLYAIDYEHTDIFGSVGVDFTLAPRANYMVGIGHRFKNLRRAEISLTHTYENNANHGFLKTKYGAQTDALGLSRSIHLPGRFTSFAAVHGGATRYTGNDKDPKTFFNATYGVGI